MTTQTLTPIYEFGVTYFPATFIERPNRFVGVIQLPDKKQPVTAHIADPGRLKELLYLGANVLVQDHGVHTTRKHRYSVPLVYADNGSLVSIHSQLPNKLVLQALEHNALPGFKDYRLVQKEFTPFKATSTENRKAKLKQKHSRFDFLLEHQTTGKRCLLEVKGASLVEDGHCLFPDAPTERGTRHVRELIEAQQHGYQAAVLVVIQRDDAKWFSPHWDRDLHFAKALDDAVKAGVRCDAITTRLTPQSAQLQYGVPVETAPV